MCVVERKLAQTGASVAMLVGGVSSEQLAVKARRLTVFKSLLKLLTPEQKFTVAARMAQDVLAAVVDGVLSLTDLVGLLVFSCYRCTPVVRLHLLNYFRFQYLHVSIPSADVLWWCAIVAPVFYRYQRSACVHSSLPGSWWVGSFNIVHSFTADVCSIVFDNVLTVLLCM